MVIKKFHTAGHPSTAYYHGFTGTKPALSPEQDEVIGLSFSFITVHCRIWLPVPGFPCSNSPIFPYSRRPLLYSCQLAAACNGTRSFLGTGCTQPHWPPLSGALHFYSFPYRSVNSKIRQCFTHTGHSYFIDIQPIRYITCLQVTFVDYVLSLRCLSAAFSGLHTVRPYPDFLHAAVSMWAFPGVTPSFHPSES